MRLRRPTPAAAPAQALPPPSPPRVAGLAPADAGAPPVIEMEAWPRPPTSAAPAHVRWSVFLAVLMAVVLVLGALLWWAAR